MTDFYRLPLAERGERLRALATVALARWGVRDCEPEIVKVRENAVFRVAAADGRDAVLRVHRHGYHSDAALRSELAWLEALHADGIAVPAVIPSAAGEPFEIVQGAGVPEPRQVDMLTWMPGIPIGTLEEGLNPAIADVHAVFAGVGRLCARLHNQTEAWTPPAGFTRHAWDREGLVGPEPLWGRFWETAVLGTEERRLIERARASAREALTAYGRSPRRYGLIHADFNLDNMLLDGERVIPLDFDDCGFGWHLFDLATVWTIYHGSDLAEADSCRSRRGLSPRARPAGRGTRAPAALRTRARVQLSGLGPHALRNGERAEPGGRGRPARVHARGGLSAWKVGGYGKRVRTPV